MNNRKGFTLIEILTVILIIGILAGVAYPQYRRVMLKSQGTQAISLLRVMLDSGERLALAKGYRSYVQLRAADTGSTMSTLAHMDMFDSVGMPTGCSVASSYEITCGENASEALRAFRYKLDKSVNGKYYVVAQKLAEPYKGTCLFMEHAADRVTDSGVYCKGTETACSTYGFPESNVDVKFYNN